MHILYIHQHFAVPSGSTGTRSYEFARRWIKNGHQVTIITGHYDISGLDCKHKNQKIDGIKIIVAGTEYGNKMSFVQRVSAFITFIFAATLNGLKVKDVDVIYATSTPLTVGIPAMALKWLRRKPFVFEVRDQWPEIPIELGIIKNKLLIKMLLWLERSIYKSSSAIVALSPGQANGVREIAGLEKRIEVVSNCCDTQMFRPDVDGSRIREGYGWGDKFIFFHAGAMGKVNSLHFIIDVAEKLKDNENILFVLLGQGNEKSILKKTVSKLNLGNVQILPSVPKNLLPEVFAAVDIGLVIIGNYPIIQHNSANKFFDSLSAGKPVLLNYSGWQREILEDDFAGLGCVLYNLDEFVEKVLYLSSHPQEVKQMGLNARKLAIERFDRDRLAMEALNVIEKVKLSL